MSDQVQEPAIIGGFTIDKNGKPRDNGKLLPNALSEQIIAGTVITGFSLDDLRKKKARKAQSGTADMVAALRDISPAIEHLRVGDTAKIQMPKVNKDGKDPKRAFVMSIVSKLNNLTAASREWAGKVFDSASDPEGDFFYVTRCDDTATPHVRKATGRKSATASSLDRLNNAVDAAKAHLEGGKLTEEVKEDATVIKH